MKKIHTILLVIIIFALVILGTVFVLNLKQKQEQELEIENDKKEQMQLEKDELENIKLNYETQVKVLVNQFLESDKLIARDNYNEKISNINSTINDLLDLRLTAEYKKLHLDLVVALDMAKRGYEAFLSQEDQDGRELISEYENELVDILDEYQWLIKK